MEITDEPGKNILVEVLGAKKQKLKDAQEKEEERDWAHYIKHYSWRFFPRRKEEIEHWLEGLWGHRISLFSFSSRSNNRMFEHLW